MSTVELAGIALLTLRVALVATLAGLAPAVGLAWLLARREFRGRSFVQACVALPMVLPPVAATAAQAFSRLFLVTSSRGSGPPFLSSSITTRPASRAVAPRRSRASRRSTSRSRSSPRCTRRTASSSARRPARRG